MVVAFGSKHDFGGAGVVKHIVKRGGKSEAYDVRKLYASIYATCVSVHEPVGAAEMTADKVCKDVELWLMPKSEVSSNDIRKIAAKNLNELNPHAAFMYKHHRIMW